MLVCVLWFFLYQHCVQVVKIKNNLFCVTFFILLWYQKRYRVCFFYSSIVSKFKILLSWQPQYGQLWCDITNLHLISIGLCILIWYSLKWNIHMSDSRCKLVWLHYCERHDGLFTIRPACQKVWSKLIGCTTGETGTHVKKCNRVR